MHDLITGLNVSRGLASWVLLLLEDAVVMVDHRAAVKL